MADASTHAAHAHHADDHGSHGHVQLHYHPGLPLTNGKLIVWLFLSTEIMFFAGLDRHVYRAAVRCPDLAAAARGAPERADRRLQHVRADLLQREHRAGLGGGPGEQGRRRQGCGCCITLVLGSVFLGVKMYEYNAKFQHGIYPWKPHSLIYEKADLNYAAAVRLRLEALKSEYDTRETS